MSGLCVDWISTVLTFTQWSPASVVLPDQVVWTVAFNTSTAGYNPLTNAPCRAQPVGCPYDSLNVGTLTFPNAPYAGADLDPDVVYRSVGSAPLQPESGWRGYTPLGAITTQ